MIHITKKSSCCGCTACFNICPKNAISMQPDEEGFLYPVVDQEKCVDCGLCEKICPVSSKKSHEEQTDAYIIRYNNQKIVEESTSGGAFTAISSYVFENGGIVYGTGYDADMKVICKKAACMEDLKEMRGSKFVQSSLDRTFQEIKTELKTEKLILFTGTPCQVSGLIHYLGKHPENLISMDFVCRGVPSPGLWKNYVDYMEGKYHSKMIGARFKHKTYGYHTTTMKIDFQNGASYFGSGRVDPYMKAFVREMSSRPSCAECAFKGIERLSDITVFDCYEYTQITGYKDDDKGYVRPNVGLGSELQNAMQADIDDVLHLNGEKDSNGKIEWDTRSKLVAGRRCICDSVHSQFDRWSKKGFLTVDYLQEKIEKLESQLKEDNIADEYIGVRLYLYKRKKEKLEKQK